MALVHKCNKYTVSQTPFSQTKWTGWIGWGQSERREEEKEEEEKRKKVKDGLNGNSLKDEMDWV